MTTPICPSCGCSLVRLGITREKAIVRMYHAAEYRFCCDGCAVLFDKNPQALLNETKHLRVCPSCLAEKPIAQTVVTHYQGETLHFCRCPHCMTVFRKYPEYYLGRLAGSIEFAGVFTDGNGCC